MDHIDNLESLLKEIEYLKESHNLLEKLNHVLMDHAHYPYNDTINGTVCGDLIYKIAEHFGFDDGE